VSRTAHVARTTNETTVELGVKLDGASTFDIGTGIGFFDHMLSHIAKHGNLPHSVGNGSNDIECSAYHSHYGHTLLLSKQIYPVLRQI